LAAIRATSRWKPNKASKQASNAITRAASHAFFVTYGLLAATVLFVASHDKEAAVAAAAASERAIPVVDCFYVQVYYVPNVARAYSCWLAGWLATYCGGCGCVKAKQSKQQPDIIRKEQPIYSAFCLDCFLRRKREFSGRAFLDDGSCAANLLLASCFGRSYSQPASTSADC